MANLQPVKSERFGEIQCDIYKDGDELYMTREQIGRALEYENPRSAIKDIHSRHKERLNNPNFSRGAQIEPPSGGKQTAKLYTRKGAMEICRHSSQPKADAFMDWVWDIMDGLIAGKAKIIDMTEYQRRMVETRSENIKIRKARELTKLAEKYSGQTFAQILDSYATEVLTGEKLIPLPAADRKTYSAGDIGGMFGVSSQKIGRLANMHGLKIAEYGQMYHDKSRYSAKEVDAFRYFDTAIPVFRELLGA